MQSLVVNQIPENINKRSGTQTDEDGNEYVVYQNVPVFDEHVDDEGTVYDFETLCAIAKNQNDRIEDSGDHVVLIEGHNYDEEVPRSMEPDVLGDDGPYFVAKYGRKRPRWCIFSKSHRIRKEKFSKVRDRGLWRRSVEIWPEQDKKRRFFDTIALLGPETPQLALGMLKYSRKGDRKCYNFTAAASDNTYIAGDESKPIKNQKGSTDMQTLSTEALQQIAEVVKPIVEQYVQEATVHLGKVDPPAIDETTELGQEAPLDAGVELDPNAGGEVLPPESAPEIPEDDDDIQFGKSAANRLMKRYMKEGEFDAQGAKSYLGAMDEQDRESVNKYAKSSDCCDEFKKHYAKCTATDDDGDELEMSAKKYRKQNNELTLKYQKVVHERDSLQRKYNKRLEELTAAKDELTEGRKSIKYARDRSRVEQLVTQFGLQADPDEEATKMQLMSEEDSKDHLELIRKRYQRAPIGAAGIEASLDHVEKPADISDQETKSKKYARPARNVVEKYRKKGVELSYQEALDWMCENDSEKYEPKKEAVSAS